MIKNSVNMWYYCRETKQLKTLSGKLMELITVGSTQLDWQTVPLTSIMEEVGQALQISLSKSGITLNIKGSNKIEIVSGQRSA